MNIYGRPEPNSAAGDYLLQLLQTEFTFEFASPVQMSIKSVRDIEFFREYSNIYMGYWITIETTIATEQPKTVTCMAVVTNDGWFIEPILPEYPVVHPNL